MYLLDTNVISELNRPQPDPNVQSWIRSQPATHFLLSVVTLAEIVQGIHGHPDAIQRHRLQRWLDRVVRPWLGDNFLPINGTLAETAGEFLGAAKRGGLTLSFADAAIAATARHHQLTLVTRNVRHFQSLGITIVNPWDKPVQKDSY